MYYVYVLFSLKDRKLYVGYSQDIEKRIEDHNHGRVTATENRLPIKLIYFEAYLSSTEAKRREQYLKGGSGRAQLKVQLQETLKDCGYKYLS